VQIARRQKLPFVGNMPERKNPDQANSTFRMESGMAYISQRGAYWRAEIRRRGHKPIYRTFDTKQLAHQWAVRTEAEITAGVFVDRTEAERTILRDALDGNRPATALLQEVKNRLARTYPNTDMSGDGQVVLVNFGSYNVEVVPPSSSRRPGATGSATPTKAARTNKPRLGTRSTH
jgi:hypothetical protein